MTPALYMVSPRIWIYAAFILKFFYSVSSTGSKSEDNCEAFSFGSSPSVYFSILSSRIFMRTRLKNNPQQARISIIPP